MRRQSTALEGIPITLPGASGCRTFSALMSTSWGTSRALGLLQTIFLRTALRSPESGDFALAVVLGPLFDGESVAFDPRLGALWEPVAGFAGEARLVAEVAKVARGIDLTSVLDGRVKAGSRKHRPYLLVISEESVGSSRARECCVSRLNTLFASAPSEIRTAAFGGPWVCLPN